jgi:hypothetical protein
VMFFRITRGDGRGFFSSFGSVVLLTLRGYLPISESGASVT